MSKYRLTLSEQEVIIRRCADEGCWGIYSSIPAFTRKMLKLAGHPDVSAEKAGAYGYRFTLPLSCIRFVAPRTLTEAERERRRRALMRSKEATADVSR